MCIIEKRKKKHVKENDFETLSQSEKNNLFISLANMEKPY